MSRMTSTFDTHYHGKRNTLTTSGRKLFWVHKGKSDKAFAFVQGSLLLNSLEAKGHSHGVQAARLFAYVSTKNRSLSLMKQPSSEVG